MLEHEIQNDIIENLLRAGIYCFRNNSGAFSSQYENKKGEVKTRFIQFGLPGSSDIIAIYKGLFVGIEVKRKGGKQSDEQKAFQRNVEDSGGIYILAFSWDDVNKKIQTL